MQPVNRRSAGSFGVPFGVPLGYDGLSFWNLS
jgi:hypothetical protein